MREEREKSEDDIANHAEDIQDHIDSCRVRSEKRAQYMEENGLCSLKDSLNGVFSLREGVIAHLCPSNHHEQ